MLRQLQRSLVLLFKQNWLKCSSNVPKVLGFPRIPVNSKLGDGFEYEFIQIPPGSSPEVIETDVIIVGSGCGAGVTARNLAEAGHSVIVAEKSYYWAPTHFPMTDAEGWSHLFMNGAFILCRYFFTPV